MARADHEPRHVDRGLGLLRFRPAHRVGIGFTGNSGYRKAAILDDPYPAGREISPDPLVPFRLAGPWFLPLIGTFGPEPLGGFIDHVQSEL
jgi:hypothetical protein